MDFPVLTLGLGSSRRSKAANWGSTRPMQVENLEERLTPTGGKYVSPKLSYTVVQSADSEILIQGRVTGTYNANSTVTFNNSSVSTSLTTDSAGYFTLSGASGESIALLGTLSGTAWDTRGTQTNTVSTVLDSLPPTVLSFTVENIGGTTWRLSGSVLNEYLAGLEVSFSGSCLDGLTVNTDENGNFYLEIESTTDLTGCCITATVTDAWGLTGSLITTADA